MHVSLGAEAVRLSNPFLNCIGAGRAKEVMFASFQEALEQAQAHIGFPYIRFHGLYHEDMYPVSRDSEGRLQLNFTYIDMVMDTLMAHGIRPFVEFSFTPECMKSGEKTQFIWKSNVTPPRDLTEWAMLIRETVLHWKERYGLEEIRRWYYEVWNEPDLGDFWAGTRSEYFELYKVTSKAVKGVDPELRIGGPATSNYVPDSRFDGEREDPEKALTLTERDLDALSFHGVWIEAFLQYCAENSLPVDFVSTHPYPTDFALDRDGTYKGRTREVHSLNRDIDWLRGVLGKSAYPGAEIHLTEWSSSPSSRDTAHDGLREAVYVLRNAQENLGLVQSVSYWALTDVFEEIGAGPSMFHGGFGLMHYHTVRKPVFTAFEYMACLGDEVIARGEDHMVTRKNGTLAALFWHDPQNITPPMRIYPDRELSYPGGEKVLELTLEGLKPFEHVTARVCDAEHGWAQPLWVRLGRPAYPLPAQAEVLRREAEKTAEHRYQADADGMLHVTLRLKPFAFALLLGVGDERHEQ